MPNLRFAGAVKIAALLVFVGVIAAPGFGQVPPKVSFIARTDYAGAASPAGVVSRDLNADGNMDLVTVSYNNSVSVLLGNADGTFQPPVNYAVASDSGVLQLGDFNGDGKLDILVAGVSTTTGRIASVSVLLGNSDGTFQTALVTNLVNSNSDSVAVGDFNNDGKDDIVFAVAVPQLGDSQSLISDDPVTHNRCAVGTSSVSA